MATFKGSPFTGKNNGTNKADVFLGEVTGCARAYGALQAEIDAGNGMDSIHLMGQAVASTEGYSIGYGAYDSDIHGDNGMDTITLTGKVSASKGSTGISYGACESDIYGDNGDDIINISATASIALSIPTWFINPANGHIYFLTDPNLGRSWTQAEAQAVSAGGHLVTINDAAEQSWLNNTFNSLVSFGTSLVRESFWIGLYDPQGDNTDEWVSGESVNYTNWANGEPNNSEERYGELNPLFAPDKWNDRSDFASEIGGRGIVEIDPKDIANIAAYGVCNSSVNGGNGNDVITIFGTNFGIKDSLISGGNGNDTFNVGMGQGTIDGGRGIDHLIIDYFRVDPTTHKPTNVRVAAVDGNISISGNTDQCGNGCDLFGQSNAWIQTIKGMEQFLVNGVSYTPSQFLSTFG